MSKGVSKDVSKGVLLDFAVGRAFVEPLDVLEGFLNTAEGFFGILEGFEEPEDYTISLK